MFIHIFVTFRYLGVKAIAIHYIVDSVLKVFIYKKYHEIYEKILKPVHFVSFHMTLYIGWGNLQSKKSSETT